MQIAKFRRSCQQPDRPSTRPRTDCDVNAEVEALPRAIAPRFPSVLARPRRPIPHPQIKVLAPKNSGLCLPGSCDSWPIALNVASL